MVKLVFEVSYAPNSYLLCDHCNKVMVKGKIVIGRIWKSPRLARCWRHLDCLGEKVAEQEIEVELDGEGELVKQDRDIVNRRIQLFIENKGRHLGKMVLKKQNLHYPQHGPKEVEPQGMRTRAMAREERRKNGESVVSPRKRSPHPYNTLLPAIIKRNQKLLAKKGKARKLMERATEISSNSRSRSKSPKRKIRGKSEKPKRGRSRVSSSRKERQDKKKSTKKPQKRRAKSMDSSSSPSPPKAQNKLKRVARKKKKQESDSEVDGPTEAQRQKYEDLVDKYSQHTVADLKQSLKSNFMKMTGNKDELAKRIAGAVMFGYIRLCRKCGGGKPNFNFEELRWKCPGFMEDTKHHFCNKREKVGEAEVTKFISE